jgi:hypothetical protein
VVFANRTSPPRWATAYPSACATWVSRLRRARRGSHLRGTQAAVALCALLPGSAGGRASPSGVVDGSVARCVHVLFRRRDSDRCGAAIFATGRCRRRRLRWITAWFVGGWRPGSSGATSGLPGRSVDALRTVSMLSAPHVFGRPSSASASRKKLCAATTSRGVAAGPTVWWLWSRWLSGRTALVGAITANWIAAAYECGGDDGLVPSRPRAAGRSTTRMSGAFCR